MDDATRPARRPSEKRQRSRLMPVRWTPAEFAQLEVAAERAGMTIGAFVRHQCLSTAGPRAQRRPPVERAALAQLLAWVGRCNGNLNQLAKIANTTGDVPPGIEEAISDLRAAAHTIMQTLGKRDV